MESSPGKRKKRDETRGIPAHAVFVSLLLHVLVLAMLPASLPIETAQTPAHRLEGYLLPRAALAQAETKHDEPEPKPPARLQPLAGPVKTGRTAATTVAPAPTFIPEPSSVAGNTAGESVPRLAEELATVALAPVAVERGVDAAGLRQFRLALAGEARRLRRYPEQARRAGLAGTTEVRIAVEAGGTMRRADLSRSSGHALLDAAALEMLGEAVTRTSLPESLRGRNFAVLLPVVFEVED